MIHRRCACYLMFVTIGAALLSLAGLGGCYQHIVRAEGDVGGRHEVYEPNLKDEDIASPPKREKTYVEKRVPTKTTTATQLPNKTVPNKTVPAPASQPGQ